LSGQPAVKIFFYLFPSADKLRQKFEKRRSSLEGLQQKGSPRKNIPASVFFGFVRERPGAQRSISADLIFWLLFYQEKSNSPAAIERESH
jgi:hypothetical protein